MLNGTKATHSAAVTSAMRQSRIRRSPWNTLDVEVLNSNPVLAVHDLEWSAAWYRDVLGCETRDPDPGNWTFCRSGAIDFMLGRCPEAVAASELGDHSYFGFFATGDVDALHAEFAARGALIRIPYFSALGRGKRSPTVRSNEFQTSFTAS